MVTHSLSHIHTRTYTLMLYVYVPVTKPSAPMPCPMSASTSQTAIKKRNLNQRISIPVTQGLSVCPLAAVRGLSVFLSLFSSCSSLSCSLSQPVSFQQSRVNELAFLRMMAVNRKITSKPKTAVSHGRYIHKHAAGDSVHL